MFLVLMVKHSTEPSWFPHREVKLRFIFKLSKYKYYVKILIIYRVLQMI